MRVNVRVAARGLALISRGLAQGLTSFGASWKWVCLLRGEPVCSQAGKRPELFTEREKVRKTSSLVPHRSVRATGRPGQAGAGRGARPLVVLEEYQHLLDWGEEEAINQPSSGSDLSDFPAGPAQRSDHRSAGQCWESSYSTSSKFSSQSLK